jgi:hypothetical protein
MQGTGRRSSGWAGLRQPGPPSTRAGAQLLRLPRWQRARALCAQPGARSAHRGLVTKAIAMLVLLAWPPEMPFMKSLPTCGGGWGPGAGSGAAVRPQGQGRQLLPMAAAHAAQPSATAQRAQARRPSAPSSPAQQHVTTAQPSRPPAAAHHHVLARLQRQPLEQLVHRLLLAAQRLGDGALELRSVQQHLAHSQRRN